MKESQKPMRALKPIDGLAGTIHITKAGAFFAFTTMAVMYSLFPQWCQIFGINTNFYPYCYFSITVMGLALLFKVTPRGRARDAYDILVVGAEGVMMWMMTQAVFDGVVNAGMGQDGIAFCVAVFTMTLFFVITGRLRLGIILGSTFWYVLSIVNFFVFKFRGEALFAGDLLSLKTGLAVSEGYSFELSGNIVAGTIIFAAMVVLAFQVRPKIVNPARRLPIRGTLAFILIYAFLLFMNMGNTVEKYYYTWEPQFNDYLYSFSANFKMLNLAKPEGYSTAKVEKITRQAVDDVAKQVVTTKKPTVIAIMNESFSDLSVMGDFKTNTDYMPFYRSLTKDTIKGNLFVDVLGGGTCDSEYEFLTGNSLTYFPENARPYQIYVDGDTPSLVSTLNDQGYESHAIHPGQPNAWNRTAVYKDFGFEDFTSLGNQTFSETTHNNLVSDAASYEKVISLYENKGDNPLFVFDVTIANHGGYDALTSDQERIAIEGLSGSYPQAETYLSCIKRSDDDLKELVTYFQSVKEPVILVFFGDHQPSVENEFAEEIVGKPMSEWTEEELQRHYETTFCIWANYDIPEKDLGDLSINYLSSVLLDTAKLEKTAFNQYSLNLSKTLPVITSKGIMDSQGNYYDKDAAGDYADEALDFKNVVFNNIYDTKHRLDSLYYLKNHETQDTGQ